MIKKKIVVACLLLTAVTANAQIKKTVAPKTTNSHLKVFDLSIASGDVTTATTALNYYLTEQGSDNAYADTLAMLYMQQGAFAQSYYWANKKIQMIIRCLN